MWPLIWAAVCLLGLIIIASSDDDDFLTPA